MKLRVNKDSLADIMLLLGTALVLVAQFAAWEPARLRPRSDGRPPERLMRDYNPTLGPPDACVTVVEFLDPESEPCASIHPTVKHLLREFDGRLRLVVRYMPLHGNSMDTARLLEGARAEHRYWMLLDKVFDVPRSRATPDTPRLESLVEDAREIGVSERALREARRSPETAWRIEQDERDGIAFGVRDTPTFFVNGRALEQPDPAALRDAVVDAIRERQQNTADGLHGPRCE